MENSEPCTSNKTEEETIEITCKSCKKNFKMKSIVQHITKSKCKATYSKDEELSLRKRSKELSSIKKAKLEKQNKVQIAARKAKKEKENRVEIAARKAEKYKEKRVEISIKNRKKKWDTAKKYSKVKRAEKYREKKDLIAKKYKDEKEQMESNEGKRFLKIFDKISSDYYCTMRQKLYEEAFDTLCENRDDIFPDDKSKFDKYKFDRVHEEARKISDIEWKYAVQNTYGEGFLPGYIYPGVEERSKKKAFDTLYDGRFYRLYENVYDNAMEKTILSDLFWGDDSDPALAHLKKIEESYHDPTKVHLIKMQKLFDENFEKEMDDILALEDLPKMIEKIIEEELDIAIKKRFAEFKDYCLNFYPYGVSCHNHCRKRWAIDTVEEIKKKFDILGWTDEKSKIISNAQDQIEKIFSQYDDEVKTAEKKAEEIKVSFYCFSKVVEVYSDLKAKVDYFKNFYPVEKYNDKYRELIEKLWVEMEIDKEKCVCFKCQQKGPYCDHKRHQWESCERIKRQRIFESDIRTCPICQTDFPKEKFEKPEYINYWEEKIDFHDVESCSREHGFFLGVCDCLKSKK